MNRKIFSACFAVLSITACKERAVQSPAPQAQRAPASAPAIVALVDDGGSGDDGIEVETDVLGLSHEDLGAVRHMDRVAELKAQGDSEAALMEGRKALFDDPADMDALWETAELAKTTGEKHLAVIAFDRLSTLAPNDAVPLIQSARILMELDDAEGARKVALMALERDEENPEATHLLGRSQLSLDNLDEAIRSFEKTLELSADHPHALNNLGFAYLRANRNEEAVPVLERAVELLPDVAYVHNNLGVAYERMGRTGEARMAYEDALAASPRYIKARLNVERMDREFAKAQVDGENLSTEPESDLSDTQP